MDTAINDRANWLLKMLEVENNCDFAIGGLADEFGTLAPSSVAACLSVRSVVRLPCASGPRKGQQHRSSSLSRIFK